jgi:uncharacterized lipoprotein
MVTSKKLLRGSIAALRGTRFLAYLFGMSRSLRSVRLALKSLATFFRGSPMKVLHGVIAGVCLVSLAGCSLFAQKNIDYRSAAGQVPALEVPPDLTQPASVDAYKVPQSGSTTTASDANNNGVPKIADDIAMQVEESGVNSILIKDKFDKSWRRVGLAIESLNLAVEDKDRSKGIYYLLPIKAGGSVILPKEMGDTQTSYRVLVQDDGATCTVTVTAADGLSDAASKLVLEALYKNIQP